MAAGRRSRKKKQGLLIGLLRPFFVKKTVRRRRTSLRGRIIRFFLKWGLLAGIWCTVIAAMLVVYYAMDLPDLSGLSEISRTPSVTVLDRDGTVVGRFGQMEEKDLRYDEIPKTFVDAVVATEDRRFFEHWGVDVVGLLRAAYVNARAGHVVQGGSTITQQLVKVVLLKPERTFKRKIQEVMLALYLEKHFSKEQIFSMYANRVYLGAGNYGIEAASHFYFNKSARQINLYESAMLAGMIQAPSRYAPTNNPKLTQRRTNQVLLNMYNRGKLPTPLTVTAKSGLDFKAIQEEKKPQYLYFSRWVREQLPDYIGNTKEDVVVWTTFDKHLQEIAEKSLTTILSREGVGHKVTQGGLVMLSPEGEVLAMVGGVDAAASEFNRATQALRQPGSSFKLFVYLAALEYGLTPEDMMLDAPVSIGKWHPANYHRSYAGIVPLDYAFAHSINTVAVRLAQKVGIGRVISLANRLGITTPMNNDLSSALGTSEVNLLELTSAYAHLANAGRAVWTHAITSVVTTKGRVLYQRTPPDMRVVLSPEVVGQMNAMLLKVVESGTGKAAQLDRPAAGKTGTSQAARDAWFIGFSGDYVAGVWVGNDDNRPMKNVTGGGIPAQIWKACMMQANQGRPVRAIPVFTKGSGHAPGEEGGVMSLWNKLFGGAVSKPVSSAVRAAPDINPPSSDEEWEGIQTEEPQADPTSASTPSDDEPEVIWDSPGNAGY